MQPSKRLVIGVIFLSLFSRLFALPETSDETLGETPAPAEDNWYKQYLTPTPSAKAQLTSNYIWRGVSQSNNAAAVQGQFQLSTPSGLHLTVWGSTVNFDDNNEDRARLEIIPEIKFIKKMNISDDEGSIEIGARRYIYPKSEGLNFNEYFIGLNYDVLFIRLDVTNTFYASNDTAIYASAGFNSIIPPKLIKQFKGISWGGHFGHYEFKGGTYGERDYTDYALFVQKAWNALSLRLSWTGTNGGYNGGSFDNSGFILTIAAFL